MALAETHDAPALDLDRVPRPTAYAIFSVGFASLFAGFITLCRRTGRTLPERPDARDIALAALATQKLSVLVTRDRVTSPLRAPFTENDGEPPPGATKPEPRGCGMRRVIGELVTCPYCAGVWIAAGLSYGMVLAPRPTRLFAGIFGTVALADFAHRAYRRLADE